MKKNNNLTIGIVAAAAVILYIKRKPIMEAAQVLVWDVATATRIATLHPQVRQKAIDFINAAEKKGIKLRVVSAFRSIAEQNKLYAQGRTAPGNIVTKAKGGQSSHNFGTAIDVVPIVNGQPDWDTDWHKIATIGKSLGFSWGGDWKSFKDVAHVEAARKC